MGQVLLSEQANLLLVMFYLKDLIKKDSDSSQTIPVEKALNWYASL